MAVRPSAQASGEAAQEKVEEAIFGIPGILSPLGTSGNAPPLFQKFMDGIFPLLDLPKTSRFVLEAFSSRDVTAEKLSQALKANVYFQDAFYRVIESLSRRKEGDAQPSLESAIVLMGMQNSRNLILALQMQRSVLGSHPEWTKEGKLKTAPKEFLKYALQAEESTAGGKDDYIDLAFSAGFLFDIFVLIASSQEHKKKLLPFIDGVYKQGFKTAQIGAAISKALPEFGFRRYLFAACMLHDIGKISLAILEPSYMDFLEECGKKDLPRALRKHAELRRFGLNHSLLGAMTCYSFKVFSSFARALLYQHEPFLLSLREKKLFELSALISLSTNVANNFKKIDKPDDPVVARWKGPELGSYKIDMAKVIQAVSKIP